MLNTSIPAQSSINATIAYQVVSDYTARMTSSTATSFRLLNRINRPPMTTMTDFNALDADGQITSLNTLAREALIYYGLNFAAPELLNYSNNAVYHVHAGTHRYVLRIHRPGHKHLAWIRSELAWLSALRRDTDLRVPEPAAPIYTGTLPGVMEPVYAVLFRWLPGEAVSPQTMTTEQARQTGIFAAKLHNHSQSYQLPDDFARPRLDYDGMFGVNSPYYPGEPGEALLTDSQRAVMTAAQAQIK
ncbi:MAG TPA: phosphotransferase, partial [Phototrophicaceae bacterium]|nr:phosphotransferase [Phototrophicaceae bacterium]